MADEVQTVRLAKWLELSQYDMVINHRPGREYGNADYLSRPEQLCVRPLGKLNDLPCGGSTTCSRAEEKWSEFLEEVGCVIPLPTYKKGNTLRVMKINHLRQLVVPNWCSEFNIREMVTLKKKDQDLSLVIAWLTTNKLVSRREVTISSPSSKHFWQIRAKLSIQNDMVMLEGINGPVLVVPDQMKQTIMEACHGSATAGHQGDTKIILQTEKEFSLVCNDIC